jgi:hypothetical protein
MTETVNVSTHRLWYIASGGGSAVRRLVYFPYASGDDVPVRNIADCLLSREDRMSSWSDDHLLQHLRSLECLPKRTLDIPALMYLAIERLRLDIALYEQYEFQSAPILSNLLIAPGGSSDRRILSDEIIKWTPHAELFDSKILPEDHFFIRSQLSALARIVVAAAETVCRTLQAYESKVTLWNILKHTFMNYVKQLAWRPITWGLIAIGSTIGALLVIQYISPGLPPKVDLLPNLVSALMPDGRAENVDALVATLPGCTLGKIAGVTETASVNVHSTTRIAL